MLKQSLILTALVLLGLTGCKQELPKTVDSPAVFGTVQDLSTSDNEMMLVYSPGEDPYTKTWGKAGNFYVTVENKKYMLAWDEAKKFKTLKVGDKVNLHPSEYIGCLGQNDLKPACQPLYRVYRNETRINPIQGK